MAVQATLTQQVLRRHTACQSIRIVGDTGVSTLRVTALAKKRSTPREHPGMVRPMRVMARRAIFGDRRMFPEERTTFLRVALETGIVHGLPNQLQLRRIAKHAVTTGAVHLAFTQGVRIRFQCITLAQGMTVITFVGLRRCVEHRVTGGVNLVTAGTADFVVVMRPAVPCEPGIGLMTSEAHPVLRLDAGGRIGTETDDRRPLSPTPHPASVRSAGAVAGFTL